MLQKLKALLLGLGAPTVTVEGGAGDASGMGAAGVTVGAPRSLADWGATLGCRQTERLHFAGILLASRTKRGSWMTWPVERPSSDLQALSSSLRHTHVSAAAAYSSGCRPRTAGLAAAGTGPAVLCSRHAQWGISIHGGRPCTEQQIQPAMAKCCGGYLQYLAGSIIRRVVPARSLLLPKQAVTCCTWALSGAKIDI